MKNYTLCLTLVLVPLLFSSCAFFSQNSGKTTSEAKDAEGVCHIIEAEARNLSGYQAENEGAHSFIAATGSTATARFRFSLPSGYFDIDIRYLAEQIGQNTYSLYVDDNQIVAWLGKDRDDQWHMLSEQRWHVPKKIRINTGDEIRIEALPENGSRVILDYIQFRESAPPDQSPSSSVTDRTAIQGNEQLIVPGENVRSIYPDAYSRAIKNPLKGFRSGKEGHEYSTLIKYYFRWNALENSASDDVDKIVAACDTRWRGIEKQNIKAIPRVYLEYPGRQSGWPADMTTGDYTSDQFRQRVVSFIQKLGEAWDNDPRVAYVEMGLIGQWGEMEFPDTKDDIKKAMAEQFNRSFKNKLVMIRWPNTYYDHVYNFGYYWDSFAHHDQEYCGFHIMNTSPKWQTAVIGGEAAYNWGKVYIQPGESPDISLKMPEHRDYIIDRIRKLHANHLGWISEYNPDDPEVAAGAELMQKALGYRFVITEVHYPEQIHTDSLFSVSLKVRNTGSSPFYYDWPVEISLLDPHTRKTVWKQRCTDIDIRNWLPGDQWDESNNGYAIPAKTFIENQSLLFSGDFSGEYILAIAVLDPAGNLPAVRFAIRNYFNGGRHPIGIIGVNKAPEAHIISGFDDIQSDTTLMYKIQRD